MKTMKMALLAGAAIAVSAAAAHADTFYWDNNTTTPGFGTAGHVHGDRQIVGNKFAGLGLRRAIAALTGGQPSRRRPGPRGLTTLSGGDWPWREIRACSQSGEALALSPQSKGRRGAQRFGLRRAIAAFCGRERTARGGASRPALFT